MSDERDRRGGGMIRRRRIVAAIALVLLVALGLVVARVVPESLANEVAIDVAGDALYAVAIYAGLVLVAPRMLSLRVAAIAAVWCTAVELLQLTGLPGEWARAFSPAALVFGSGFDPRDLVVYLAALVVAAVADQFVRRRGGMPVNTERLESA